MTTSKTKKTVTQALFEFNNRLVKVKKNLKNSAFPNSFYTDINIILATIQPTLEELGLVIIQTPQVHIELGSYLNTKIMLKDNPSEVIESNIKLIVNPTSPKAMWSLGGSITYTRRYAIVSMLCLESVDDDFQQGVKDAQNATKPVYNNPNLGKVKPLTPTQSRNEEIGKMKQELDVAKAEGDINKATQVWETASDKGYIQVQEYHSRLFENPQATL